jgi:hypothetical protein
MFCNICKRFLGVVHAIPDFLYKPMPIYTMKQTTVLGMSEDLSLVEYYDISTGKWYPYCNDQAAHSVG